MSGRLFVCFPKHKLRKLNEFMRKPRVLKKSKRAKKSPKLDLSKTDKTIRSRMSKDDQLDNAKISEHISNPEPKINCLTDHENERIVQLLSLCHQELFALPQHAIKKQLKKLAKSQARVLDIDENKITSLWLNEYFEKFKHLIIDNCETELGDNSEICYDVITSSPVQDLTAVSVKSKEACTSNHQPDICVPDLAALFKVPNNQALDVSSRKRKSSNPIVKSGIHIKLDKPVHRHDQAEPTANITTCQPAIKLHGLVESKQTENHKPKVTKRRYKKHYYEDCSSPLLPLRSLHPRKTGCLLMRSNKLQKPKKTHKLDEVQNQLFELCSSLKEHLFEPTSTEQLFERENKKSSPDSDDCDSGYRSRGDSQDSDKLTNQYGDHQNLPYNKELTESNRHSILNVPLSSPERNTPAVNSMEVPVGSQCRGKATKCTQNNSSNVAGSWDLSELIECTNTEVDSLNMPSDDIDFMESFFNFDSW